MSGVADGDVPVTKSVCFGIPAAARPQGFAEVHPGFGGAKTAGPGPFLGLGVLLLGVLLMGGGRSLSCLFVGAVLV